MSSSTDDAYMSFLDKANQDLSSGRSQQAKQSSSTEVRTETLSAGARIPDPLKSVEVYYVSETDEPFEPVLLKWDGAKKGVWPSTGAYTHTHTHTHSLPHLHMHISVCMYMYS